MRDNIKCNDFNSATAASLAWVTGGNATRFERIICEFGIYIKSLADGVIIRTYSW